MAQQTDLATAGEAHGKSCDLKDTRNPEDISCSKCSFSCFDCVCLVLGPCNVYYFKFPLMSPMYCKNMSELKQMNSFWSWCAYYFINVIQLNNLLFFIWLHLFLMKEEPVLLCTCSI